MKEAAARELPHRTRELALEALSGDADRELLHALVGAGTLPAELERADPASRAEGNPFFLEELVRSLVDAGRAGRATDERLAVRPRGAGRGPADGREGDPGPDRPADARRARRADGRRRCSGRRFGLPLLEGVAGEDGEVRARARRAAAARPGPRGTPVARARVPLQARADPGGGVPDAARRATGARLHRRAAEWLERRYAGRDERGRRAARPPLAGRRRRGQGDRVPDARRRPRPPGVRAGRGHRALPRAAAAPGTARRDAGDGARPVQARARAAHVAAVRARRTTTYQRAFELWTPPEPPAGRRPPRSGSASSFLPNDPDPQLRDRVAQHPALHAAVRPAGRAVARAHDRALARRAMGDRRRRPALRLPPPRGPDAGPTARRSRPTTSSSASSACSTRTRRARRWRSTSCSRTGRTTTSGRNADADRIGVRALDDRTVEFRLVAPAPYFMSVMNRPDGGPQPRHAIEARRRRLDRARRQVVSGAFRRRRSRRRASRARAARRTRTRLGRATSRAVEYRPDADPRTRSSRTSATSSTWSTVRYTPRLADLVPDAVAGRACRAGRVVRLPRVRPRAPGRRRTLELRRALAHAVDREALAAVAPINLVVATGGDRAAGAPGPHARHRPAVRPRRWPGSYLANVGLPRDARARRASTTIARSSSPSCEGWRDVLGISSRGSDRGPSPSVATLPPPARDRADLLHGMAPGLRRPRVLPPPAVPVGQPDERGRVRATRRSTS